MNDTVKNEEAQVATALTKDTAVEATITSTLSSTPTKLQLVPNWKKVLRTYSFWVMVASALLTLVEIVLPFFSLLEPTMSVSAYGVCTFVLNVSAPILRLIKQHKLWPQEEEKSV